MSQSLQECPQLTERQQQHLAELAELLEAGGCRLALSEDGERVLFYGKKNQVLCSSPISEFDY